MLRIEGTKRNVESSAPLGQGREKKFHLIVGAALCGRPNACAING
jgi:hypothetical protein